MIKEEVIKIDKGAYFNGNTPFILIGIFLLFYLPLISLSIFIAPLILILIPLFTTKNILEVDFKNKLIFEYTSVFGEGKSNGVSFEKIVSTYINKGRYKKTMASRGSTTLIKLMMYSSYIKTSEGRKYLLYKSEDRHLPQKNAEVFSKYLQITITDNTN